MSLKLTGVIILLVLAFLLGMWYQANPSEGNGAMGTFKAWVGRSLRGENCTRGYTCTPIQSPTAPLE